MYRIKWGFTIKVILNGYASADLIKFFVIVLNYKTASK